MKTTHNVRYLPRVYLDTNHWIELARIAKGKNTDTVYQKAYSKLIELSSSNKILIPFSSFNLYEIVKNNNKQQREEMIDFMVDTSRGWYFKPIDKYLKYEINNACYNKLNSTKYHNIYSNILTNRADSVLEGCIGKWMPREGSKITKEALDEAQKKLDEYMKNPQNMKKMFKQDVPRIFVKSDAVFIDKITKDLENKRDNSQGFSSQVFDKCIKTKYIIEYLSYNLPKFCHENKITIKELFNTKSEFETLIENMPALNVYVELNYVRDKESRERTVHHNDFYDIWHYATGLPYANIMIGEKMFGNISKRQKLDQKNKCIIFTSLKEIVKYDISQLLKLQ